MYLPGLLNRLETTLILLNMGLTCQPLCNLVRTGYSDLTLNLGST